MSPAKPSRRKSRPARAVNQKKHVRSSRGVPETVYGEIKKIASFSLTPTAIDLLKHLSRDLHLSASESLERIARLGPELKDLLSQDVRHDLPSNTAPEALNKP
jgi:hypothetical protein